VDYRSVRPSSRSIIVNFVQGAADAVKDLLPDFDLDFAIGEQSEVSN
jgi:hypothetical protein